MAIPLLLQLGGGGGSGSSIVQARSFMRLVAPADLAEAVAGLELEVNGFLATLSINDVLDVRYSYEQTQSTSPKVLAVVTILYLV